MTIKELAGKIGISSSTISRALAGHPNVDPGTRARVEHAAKQYGYSRSAKKSDLSDLIMVLCGDITSQVYAGHIRGVERALEENGLKVVIVDSLYDPEKEEAYIEYAVRNGFRGVIMLSAIGTDTLANLLASLRLPIVLVNRYLRTVDTDIVCSDSAKSRFFCYPFQFLRTGGFC